MSLKHLCIYLFLLIPTWVLAQNNPYGIDDHIYEYYQKCRIKQTKSEVLLMADTLFSQAIGVDDKKAQCLALYLKSDFYYYANDTLKLRFAVNEVKEWALKTSYMQYYFGASSRLITSKFKNSRLYIETLSEIKQYQKEAYRFNNAYGIASSYYLLGSLYRIQHNNQLAIENFLRSATHNEKYGNPNEAYLTYCVLGDICLQNADYEMAAFYINKSLALALENSRKAVPMLTLIKLYCRNDQADSAKYYLNKVDSIFKIEPPKGSTVETYHRAMMEYRMATDDLEEALDFASTFADDRSLRYKYQIYKKLGNFELALSCLTTADSIARALNEIELSKMILEYKSKSEDRVLEEERNLLLLQNNDLRIAQMEDERILLEAEQEKDLLLLEAAELELKNYDLNHQQQLAKIEYNRSKYYRYEERARISSERESLNRITTIILSLSFFILIVSFTIYFILRKKNVDSLKYEHNLALRAREEADVARIEAELSNRQKSVFLQNMSHEIRTPLNAIVGFSEVLNSGEQLDITPEERKEYLKLLQKNTEMLTTLVNDVLDLSSLECGAYSLSLKFKEIRLNEFCSMILKGISSRIPRQVTAKLNLPSAGDDSFYTDGIRLQQVLVNFLTNACNYTEKGTITLGYSFLASGDVEFYVEDTGPGIPADKVEDIFKRFGKLDSLKQGTGLGLNICQRIAELLTGKVYLDTNYVNGARFVFVHPSLRISSLETSNVANYES